MSMKFKLVFLVFLGLTIFILKEFGWFPFLLGKELFFFYWLLFMLLLPIKGEFSSLLGLIILFFGALFLFLGHQGFALRIAIYGYYFLLVGVFKQFIILLTKK